MYLQAKIIDDHPLCWLGFEEDCIITSCQEGQFGHIFAKFHVNVSDPTICCVEPEVSFAGLTKPTLGHIRTWDRPKEGLNGSQIATSGAGSSS